MSKKKNNRKGEFKMEEIKNEEQVVTEEIEQPVSNEGEENVTVENVDVNNDEIKDEEEVKPADEEHTGETEQDEEVKPADETEEQEEIQPDEIKNASVVKCEKLNVRKEASKNAEIVCVINKGTELTVSVDKSTEDFYKVYTSINETLVEGYCVKDFIKID